MVETSIEVRLIDEGRARVDELIKSADSSIPADGYELTLVGYYEALQATQELAAADPANAEWRRYFAVIYERIGNVWLANSDPTEALDAYCQAGLVLVDIDPADTQSQRHLIVILEKISAMMRAARGEYVAAMHASRDALELRDTLPHEDNPDGTRQQHAYFATLSMSAVYLEERDPDRALEFHRKLISLRLSHDALHKKWRKRINALPVAAVTASARPALRQNAASEDETNSGLDSFLKRKDKYHLMMLDKILAAAAEHFGLSVEKLTLAAQAARAAEETTQHAKPPRLLWNKDNAPDENPAAFAWRAYAAEAEAGTLHLGVIRQEDEPLAVKLVSWLRSPANRKQVPEGFDIPTKPEWNTRELEKRGIEPTTGRKSLRTKEAALYEAARYRAAHPGTLDM